jgi:hypothetical protein
MDDPINMSGEYTYDKNGNMTKDLNKNISSISYNLLNLPTNIAYSSGKSATYIYNNIKSQNSGFVIKTNRK